MNAMPKDRKSIGGTLGVLESMLDSLTKLAQKIDSGSGASGSGASRSGAA